MVNSEEKQKFEKICLAIQNTESGTLGIGTLGEKTLHRVLKTYLCPDSDYHEVGIGPFVADALVENTLYEIQSAGLFPLKKKLAYYLANTDKKVQIVCPILTAKRLIWVDPESGFGVITELNTQRDPLRFEIAEDIFSMLWSNGCLM